MFPASCLIFRSQSQDLSFYQDGLLGEEKNRFLSMTTRFCLNRELKPDLSLTILTEKLELIKLICMYIIIPPSGKRPIKRPLKI